MRVTLLVLVAGIAVAALVYVISGGHVLFLPLIFLFPLGALLRPAPPLLTRGSLAA